MENFLTRWRERRSLATPSPALLSLFSAGPTDSGMVVSPSSALTVPAVFSCCQVLSQDVARTPLRLRQKVAENTYVDAVDHPLYEILHDLSNPEQSAYQVKHFLQWQLLTYGRAYAEVIRLDGRVEALWPLESCLMRVDRDGSRRKRWTYTGGAQTTTWLFDPSAPPILELTCESPIQRCRELIGTALALQSYTATFFKNNAKPAGVLQATGSISDATALKLRDYWQANYAGSANRGKIPVLDQGLTFQAIQMENDSAQMHETLRAINEMIAGSFRVPPWKVGDLSKANYSNMESGELAYVTDALDPLFECWEQALRRDLLTTRQYGGFTIQFDRSALVRNDVRSLHTSLSQGIQNGYLSQNDARKALGMNPIPDGDTYVMNSALQPVGAPKEMPSVA